MILDLDQIMVYTAAEYAYLSAAAYGRTDKNAIRQSITENSNGKFNGENYDILEATDNYIVVKKKNDGGVVIACRGTAGVDDVVPDVYIATGLLRLHPRAREINRVLERYKNKYDEVTMTGHSLGGSLAAAAATAGGVMAVIFNQGSSPVDSIPLVKGVKANLGYNYKNVVSFFTPEDPISMSERLAGSEQHIVIDSDSNIFTAHSLSNFYGLNEKYDIEGGALWKTRHRTTKVRQAAKGYRYFSDPNTGEVVFNPDYIQDSISRVKETVVNIWNIITLIHNARKKLGNSADVVPPDMDAELEMAVEEYKENVNIVRRDVPDFKSQDMEIADDEFNTFLDMIESKTLESQGSYIYGDQTLDNDHGVLDVDRDDVKQGEHEEKHDIPNEGGIEAGIEEGIVDEIYNFDNVFEGLDGLPFTRKLDQLEENLRNAGLDAIDAERLVRELRIMDKMGRLVAYLQEQGGGLARIGGSLRSLATRSSAIAGGVWQGAKGVAGRAGGNAIKRGVNVIGDKIYEKVGRHFVSGAGTIKSYMTSFMQYTGAPDWWGSTTNWAAKVAGREGATVGEGFGAIAKGLWEVGGMGLGVGLSIYFVYDDAKQSEQIEDHLEELQIDLNDVDLTGYSWQLQQALEQIKKLRDRHRVESTVHAVELGATLGFLFLSVIFGAASVVTGGATAGLAAAAASAAWAAAGDVMIYSGAEQLGEIPVNMQMDSDWNNEYLDTYYGGSESPDFLKYVAIRDERGTRVVTPGVPDRFGTFKPVITYTKRDDNVSVLTYINTVRGLPDYIRASYSQGMKLGSSSFLAKYKEQVLGAATDMKNRVEAIIKGGESGFGDTRYEDLDSFRKRHNITLFMSGITELSTHPELVNAINEVTENGLDMNSLLAVGSQRVLRSGGVSTVNEMTAKKELLGAFSDEFVSSQYRLSAFYKAGGKPQGDKETSEEFDQRVSSWEINQQKEMIRRNMVQNNQNFDELMWLRQQNQQQPPTQQEPVYNPDGSLLCVWRPKKRKNTSSSLSGPSQQKRASLSSSML